MIALSSNLFQIYEKTIRRIFSQKVKGAKSINKYKKGTNIAHDRATAVSTAEIVKTFSRKNLRKKYNQKQFKIKIVD